MRMLSDSALSHAAGGSVHHNTDCDFACRVAANVCQREFSRKNSETIRGAEIEGIEPGWKLVQSLEEEASLPKSRRAKKGARLGVRHGISSALVLIRFDVR
jgi:hypothetical protein